MISAQIVVRGLVFGKISDNVCALIFTFNSMGIDKDIQQENFRSIYQKLSINLIFSTNWITEKIKNILQEEDITPQQYNILRILRGSKKPLSTLQIRERMLDKMSDTSRIVERLVKKELVEKKTSNIDKRLVDVSIAESGLELLKRLDQKNEELDAILQNLSPEEAAGLSDLLDKMREKI